MHEFIFVTHRLTYRPGFPLGNEEVLDSVVFNTHRASRYSYQHYTDHIVLTPG